MVLADTSMWVEALRANGKPAVKRRVDELLATDDICWCDMVRLELWNGARGEKERRSLHYLETVVKRLETDEQVWTESFELARRARAGGMTLSAPDVVIVACGKRHGVSIESIDSTMEKLIKFA
jgi:predicted nucleic acid-binding protein